MKNIDSQKDLTVKAIEFNKELSKLLKEYDLVDSNRPAFRLTSHKFAFVGSTALDCPIECIEVTVTYVNGKKVVTQHCTC